MIVSTGGASCAEQGTEPIDLGVLDEDIGFYCRLAQIELFSAFFHEFNGLSLSPAELSALLTLRGNPGIRQGLLGEALRIKPSAMTKVMKGLEDRGLVTRVSPRTDLRSVELNLTAAGEAEAQKADALMQGHGTRATPMLTSDERMQLLSLLKKVASGEEH